MAGTRIEMPPSRRFRYDRWLRHRAKLGLAPLYLPDLEPEIAMYLPGAHVYPDPDILPGTKWRYT